MNTIIESLNAVGAAFAGFALPMLLQSTVLIALLFALDLALRKRVLATIRYAIWMLALVKLALPPSLALPTGVAYWLPAETEGRYSVLTWSPAIVLGAKTLTTMSQPAGTVQETPSLAMGSPGISWQTVLFLVWLAMALGMGIWVVRRWQMVIGMIRQSAEAPETLRSLSESCRRQLGIKRGIRVRCGGVGSPAICGVLHPVILIPPALVENLTTSEMQSVLLHELAHYKRGDLFVSQAQIFLQVLYWYNPLLWLANAKIRCAREQAADEMVLVEMGPEAHEYPTTLLHVAKLSLGRPFAAMGLMGILEPGRRLTQRILHMMNRPLPRTARTGGWGLTAVALLALVALPMACRSKTEGAAQLVESSSAQQSNAALADQVRAWETKNFATNIPTVMYATPSLVEILPTKFVDSQWAFTGGSISNHAYVGVGQSIRDMLFCAYEDYWRPDRIVLPNDLGSTKYDFIANLKTGASQALQRKIQEQFGLIGRPKSLETNVLVLRVAKGNVQGLERHTGSYRNLPTQWDDSIFPWRNGIFEANDMEMTTLAFFLEVYLKTPVIDRTGLSDHFDFNLKLKKNEESMDWKEHNIDDFRPALLNQLGLELVPSREPIEMLVVERANN